MVRTFIQFFVLGAFCGLLGVTLGCAAAHVVEFEHPVSDSLALGRAVVQQAVRDLVELSSPLVHAAFAQLAGLSSEMELKRLAPWPYLPPQSTLLRLSGLAAVLLGLGLTLRRFGPRAYAKVAVVMAKVARREARAEARSQAACLPDWWQEVRGNLPPPPRLTDERLFRARRWR